jgi:hypothetical protein
MGVSLWELFSGIMEGQWKNTSSQSQLCLVIYWVLYCNMRIETTPQLALYFKLIMELFPSRLRVL